MRIAMRLLLNAATTYGRLAVTFTIGIFFVWYVIGRVGLSGFGAVSIGAGAFGIGATLSYTVRQSVVRHLAAALATGEPTRIERTAVSAFAFTCLAAVVVVLALATLAGIAALGVFSRGYPGMNVVLAALFAAEGLIVACELVLAPWTLAIYGGQRVGTDNLFLIAQRVVSPVAAIVAFEVVVPEGAVTERLLAFAALRAGLGVLVIAVNAVVARLLVPALRLRRAAYQREEFRTIAATAWRTAQFILAADLNPQLIMLIINLMFGLTYNGMWQIVIQVGGHVRMLGKGGLHGLDPMAAHLQEEGRGETIAHLMARAVRYQLIVLLPFAAVYMIFLAPILVLWVSGRLALDAQLAAAGISVNVAIGMIATMAAIDLLAELFRSSTFGVERMLYGLGLVHTYAWFAKWSVLLTTVAAGVLMHLASTPVVAPIPLAVVQFVYFCLIVPSAARRHAGLSLADSLRALPRPLLMAALLVVPAVALRAVTTPLTLPGLVGVGVVIGLVYVPLLLFVGLLQEERVRLWETLRGLVRRRG